MQSTWKCYTWQLGGKLDRRSCMALVIHNYKKQSTGGNSNDIMMGEAWGEGKLSTLKGEASPNG